MPEADYFSRLNPRENSAEEEDTAKRASHPGPSYPLFRTYGTTRHNNDDYDIVDTEEIMIGQSQAVTLARNTQLQPSVAYEAVDFWSRRKRPVAQLCAFCQNIFDQWSDVLTARESGEGSVFPHYQSIDSLEDSSEAGCDICNQLMISCHLVDHNNGVDSGFLAVPCALEEDISAWRFELYQECEDHGHDMMNDGEPTRWFYYIDLQKADSEGVKEFQVVLFPKYVPLLIILSGQPYFMILQTDICPVLETHSHFSKFG